MFLHTEPSLQHKLIKLEFSLNGLGIHCPPKCLIYSKLGSWRKQRSEAMSNKLLRLWGFCLQTDFFMDGFKSEQTTERWWNHASWSLVGGRRPWRSVFLEDTACPGSFFLFLSLFPSLASWGTALLHGALAIMLLCLPASPQWWNWVPSGLYLWSDKPLSCHPRYLSQGYASYIIWSPAVFSFAIIQFIYSLCWSPTLPIS